MDVSYTEDYVIDLGPPPGGEAAEGDTLKAIQWLVERTEVDGGALKIQFFGLTRATFRTLGTSCPMLAPLQMNLVGARHLLQAASRRLVLADNVASCNVQLINRLGDAAEIAELLGFIYHQAADRPELATPYIDYRNLILLVLQHIRWMEHRVRHSILLVRAHTAFLQAVDPLSDGFHALDSGGMIKDDMVNLHNHATQAKAYLKAAYDIYWSPPLGLNTPVGWEAGPGYTDQIFKVIFHNLLQEDYLFTW